MKQYLYNGKVITASSKKQVIKIVASNEKVVAKSREHLIILVKEAIEKYGNNCNLNCIDTSRVTYMNSVFEGSDFNGDISKWDVSNVTDMRYMFYGSKFNGDISKWDVSNVKTMAWMFAHSKFNGDVSNWNVSNVANMNSMFDHSSFNGNISKWLPMMKKNGIKFDDLRYPVDENMFNDIEV